MGNCEVKNNHIENLFENCSNDITTRAVNKISNIDIPLAPKKEELCIYGIGKLSIKEFRNKVWILEFSN